MNSKHYADYKVLKAVENTSNVSQRLISKQTGINLSSVNFALKRLIQKGYIKVTYMEKRRILYNLTPSGLVQKGRLAYDCFMHNYSLFSDLQSMVSNVLNRPDLKGEKIAIFGFNQITEVIYLCIKHNDCKFSGVYEDNSKLVGDAFLDGKILNLNDVLKDDSVKFLIDSKEALKDITKLEIVSKDVFFKSREISSYIIKRRRVVNGDVNIEIIGAKDTVTGSSIIFSAKGKKILIDCGLSQGGNGISNGNNRRFSYRPKEIDYLFLTHAHIDHCGRVPQLIDQGFSGEILTHHATTELYPILVEDGFNFSNGYKFKNSKSKLMENIIEQSWGFEYNRWNKISEGISFRLFDAGHILGSSTIQFNIDGKYIVFSGDIGNINTGIIKNPMAPDGADILVMESTYGGRDHSNINKKEIFLKILKKALKDGGKVLIPAFSVGRTQELIYQLNDFVEKGLIKDIPVFIDSPMGIKVTEVYTKYTDCFDAETLNRLNNNDDPLNFDKLFSVERYRDSLHLDELNGPGIIIAGSGMCTGGRIVSHIERLIEDKTTDIIFVGFQARGTLGSEILKWGQHENGYVIINDKKVFINSGIYNITGFSAHADHNGLINWFDNIGDKPKKVYLNHGEPDSQRLLKSALNKRYKDVDVVCGVDY